MSWIKFENRAYDFKDIRAVYYYDKKISIGFYSSNSDDVIDYESEKKAKAKFKVFIDSLDAITSV